MASKEGTEQPPPVTKPVPGFCLKGICRDGQTKVFINVCGHPSIGVPLARNQTEIPNWDFVDLNGIDNLMVPIAVSEPKELNPSSSSSGKKAAGIQELSGSEQRTAAGVSGTKKFIVDVVVHDELTKRCVPSHHKYEHIVSRLTDLSLSWVQQETGLVVIPKSVTMLSNVKYKSPMGGGGGRGGSGGGGAQDVDPEKIMEIMKAMMNGETPPGELGKKAAGGEGKKKKKTDEEQEEEEDASQPVPSELLINKDNKGTSGGGAAKKGPLIQELSGDGKTAKPAIRRGFLNNPKATIYGNEASKEGKMPEDPNSDPLHQIPENMRGKCQIVDMRDEGEKRHRPIPEGAGKVVNQNQQLLQDLGTMAALSNSTSSKPAQAPPPAATASTKAAVEAKQTDNKSVFAKADSNKEGGAKTAHPLAEQIDPSLFNAAAVAQMLGGGGEGGSGYEEGIFGGGTDVAPKALTTAEILQQLQREEEKKAKEAAPPPTSSSKHQDPQELGGAQDNGSGGGGGGGGGGIVIEEVSSSPSAATAAAAPAASSSAAGATSPESDWQAVINKVDQELVVVITTPPLVTSIKQLDLEIGEGSLECDASAVSSSYKKLSIALPCKIDVDAAGAKYSKKNKTLTIRAPML